jgi:hypothetical protein
MLVRIPRSLTKKRNQLAYEREQIRATPAAVMTELAALDYALTVIEPSYKPPRRATAPRSCRRSASLKYRHAAPVTSIAEPKAKRARVRTRAAGGSIGRDQA